MKRIYLVPLLVLVLFTVPVFVNAAEGDYIGVWDLTVLNADPHGITANDTDVWVLDYADASVYRYNLTGGYEGVWALTALNADPTGITTDDINIWVVDTADFAVYKYDMVGGYIGTWALNGSNTDPTGLTTDGANFWCSDNNDDLVYRYNLAGVYLSSWSVNVGNTVSTGITTDGAYVWVSDTDTTVYKYDRDGVFTSSWGFNSPPNGDGQGITTNGERFWVVDPVDTASYMYEYALPGTYGPWIFSDVYYENGTLLTPAINVTASGADFVESFNVSGGAAFYSDSIPTLFFWSIGSATRRIYSIGPETITVTYPESVFDTYVFTVRDFTGKTSLGETYLEAWRIINGVDTLIERQIIDVHNEVPLNLVTGATYSLRVRYFDDSVYTWGQVVPGDTTTFTIVLRGVDISDQAYLIGNFILVEITRPVQTQLTIQYQTLRNTTIWSNVTILIRNGAIINFQSFTNESYTYNFAVDANTSYSVLVNGDHSLQPGWGYSKSFDGTETYPDVPNIELIFPMGALESSNLIAWVFVLASGLTFSVIYRRASLIVMCAMASFFSAFGFADWNFYLLSLSWFFAVVVYLGSGDS